MAVHKPRGVLVSRVSEGGAPTLFSLLPQPFQRWYAVGRLDKDSEGLLLVCNDSWVAQRLMDPGGLPKTYLVTVQGFPSEEALARLRAGGFELDGRRVRPMEVHVLAKAPRGGTRVLVVLHEGINRQIRRCFALFGHRVRRLQRVAVGPVGLGELEPGSWRELSPEEVCRLLEGAGLAPNARGDQKPAFGSGKTEPAALTIISGGQTGVDRAALDVALELGLPCGGFCPRGRKAEDGRIPDRYPLVELASSSYAERTRVNVETADATLIFSPSPLSGGTLLTAQLCATLGKPFLVVEPGDPQALLRARQWLSQVAPRVCNVAGPRESQCPGIYAEALTFLRALFLGLQAGGGIGREKPGEKEGPSR